MNLIGGMIAIVVERQAPILPLENRVRIGLLKAEPVTVPRNIVAASVLSWKSRIGERIIASCVLCCRPRIEVGQRTERLSVQ